MSAGVTRVDSIIFVYLPRELSGSLRSLREGTFCILLRDRVSPAGTHASSASVSVCSCLIPKSLGEGVVVSMPLPPRGLQCSAGSWNRCNNNNIRQLNRLLTINANLMMTARDYDAIYTNNKTF
jgi:hypothetical protein